MKPEVGHLEGVDGTHYQGPMNSESKTYGFKFWDEKMEWDTIFIEECIPSSKLTNTSATVVVFSSESSRATSLLLIISCLEHEALFWQCEREFYGACSIVRSSVLSAYFGLTSCLIWIRELIHLVNTPKPLCSSWIKVECEHDAVEQSLSS